MNLDSNEIIDGFARALGHLERVRVVVARAMAGIPEQLLPQFDYRTDDGNIVGARHNDAGELRLCIGTDGSTFCYIPGKVSEIGARNMAGPTELLSLARAAEAYIAQIPVRLDAVRAIVAEVERLTRPFLKEV